MMATESEVWTPRWNETQSRGYALSAAQIRAFETEPAPG